jgi:hypothetical protein
MNTPIEDRLHELMDRLDHQENRIQPSDKSLVWEAIQRLRSAYKDVRELQDENDELKDRLKIAEDDQLNHESQFV